MTHSQQILATQKWWADELKKITQKVMDAETKRQEKVKAKNYAALADYTSEGQILDAYGFGCITERQFMKLTDLWQKREQEEDDDPVYRMKLDLLRELFQQAQEIILEYEGGQDGRHED